MEAAAVKVLSIFNPAVTVSSDGKIACDWFDSLTSVMDEADPWDDLRLDLGQEAADVLDGRLTAIRTALVAAEAALTEWRAAPFTDGREVAAVLSDLTRFVRPFFEKVQQG